jgi:6-phosphogluconolactonase
MARYLFVGTATERQGTKWAEGIHVYRMDPETARLEALHAVVSGPNPSFLALSPDRRFLFAVNETNDGGASAFGVDPATGSLTFLNRVKVNGDLPCYTSVAPDGKSLLIANYWSGNLTVLPVGADGRLGEQVQQVTHMGAASEPGRKMAAMDDQAGLLVEVTLPADQAAVPAAVDAERQDVPHAHSIVFDPAQKFALSADLGMDRVWIYRFVDGRLAANLPLSAQAAKTCGEPGWVEPGTVGAGGSQPVMPGQNLKPGAGPRHIAFHPNGRFCYVSNELDSTVTAFTWDGEHGALQPLQYLTTLPADFSGTSYPAHIALTPDGRWLYVSNRGHNSLAIFGVDGQSGLMTPAGYVSTLGDWPRNFCIDPDGRFLIAANQRSDSLITYAIDPATGGLTPVGEAVNVPVPFFVMVVDLGENS